MGIHSKLIYKWIFALGFKQTGIWFLDPDLSKLILLPKEAIWVSQHRSVDQIGTKHANMIQYDGYLFLHITSNFFAIVKYKQNMIKAKKSRKTKAKTQFPIGPTFNRVNIRGVAMYRFNRWTDFYSDNPTRLICLKQDVNQIDLFH